jgi:hypothetical protein
MSIRIATSGALVSTSLIAMAQTQAPDMQTIVYRGGVVEFSLPVRWVAQYGDQGGGVFWDPDVEGGTLRLDLLTFEKGGNLGTSPARSVLESLRGEGVVRDLPRGNAVREYQSFAQEHGEELKQFYWEVANFVAPNHLRLAIFSYIILKSGERDATIRKEIALLREAIPAVTFSAELGQLP